MPSQTSPLPATKITGGERRITVVTGANAGIGLEVTAGLRQAGQHVVMACRSMDRCAAAKASLDARQLHGSCECQQLDLADYASIRRFAAGLERQAAAVGTLVNNAGVMGVPPTAAGGDGHMQPNQYGPYLLTRLLLPLMAARGRIVNVASEAHHRGSMQIGGTGGHGSLTGGAPSNWYASYARSKLGNVLFTAELSRRLQQRRSSITAYSVSPGRVATNIYANVPGLLQTPLRWLAAAVFQTPQRGARTVLHAALAPEFEGRHELYLHDMRPRTASTAARDAPLAADLWQLSNQEAGVSAAEDAVLWPPN